MKKFIPLLLLVLFIQTAIAQTGNVGIGTALPNSSAALDITDAGRGLLIPRVALTASNVAAPITSPALSLLVYNTANASSGATLVTPGYYYWDGAKWIRLVNAKSLNANNGLSVVGDSLIQLGGAITQPTAITGLTATNNLTMTGTGVDAINLASNTLSVDASNSRVGIGLNNPSEKLSVSGNVLVTNLAGTGTRPVAATSNGTLTTLNRSSTNSQFFTSSGTYSVPAGAGRKVALQRPQARPRAGRRLSAGGGQAGRLPQRSRPGDRKAQERQRARPVCAGDRLLSRAAGA